MLEKILNVVVIAIALVLVTSSMTALVMDFSTGTEIDSETNVREEEKEISLDTNPPSETRNVTSDKMEVTLHGAGGGGGSDGVGGDGGYVEAIFDVSDFEEIDIWVGERGEYGGDGGWGRHEGGESEGSLSGAGGGSTEIVGTTEEGDEVFLVAADAGGGGGYYDFWNPQEGGGGARGGEGYEDGEGEGYGGDGGTGWVSDGGDGGAEVNDSYVIDYEIEEGGGSSGGSTNDDGEDGEAEVIMLIPDYIEISPQTAEIRSGNSQEYTAISYNETHGEIEDVSDETDWSIEDGAGGSWEDNVYTSENQSTWNVTGTWTWTYEEKNFTDDANLTVVPPVEYVEINPDENQTIEAGETIDFSAEVYDEEDELVTDDDAEFIWVNTNETGFFDETDAGTYDVRATFEEEYGDFHSDTIYVEVEVSDPDYIEIEPAEETVTAGEMVVYNATAFDEYGNEIEEVTDETEWSIEEGAGGHWVENEYTSEYTGEWTVTGNYTEENITEEATLTVETAERDHIEIEPAEEAVIPGWSVVYSATVYDEYGNEIEDVTEETNWSIEEGAGGNWTENEYTSEYRGEWTVTGTYTYEEENMTDEATLIVADPVYIEISPQTAQVTAGNSQEYTATAYNETYDTVLGDVTDETEWSIEEGAGGYWTENEYTSEYTGEWNISGTYTYEEENLTDNATLTVVPDEVDYVEIYPEEDQDVAATEPIDFSAEAYDQFDNLITEDDEDFLWENANETGYFFEIERGDYDVTATYGDVTSPITTVSVYYAEDTVYNLDTWDVYETETPIVDAIDEAEENHTLAVGPGDYNPDNIVVDISNLTIQIESGAEINQASPIDGAYMGFISIEAEGVVMESIHEEDEDRAILKYEAEDWYPTVDVTPPIHEENEIRIEGFEIIRKNGELGAEGIAVRGSDVTVTDNVVEGDYDFERDVIGIIVISPWDPDIDWNPQHSDINTTNVNIENNAVKGFQTGMMIMDRSAHEHYRGEVDDITVTNNDIKDNDVGLYFLSEEDEELGELTVESNYFENHQIYVLDDTEEIDLHEIFDNNYFPPSTVHDNMIVPITIYMYPDGPQTVRAGEEFEFSAEVRTISGELITDDDTDFEWENADEEGLFYEEKTGIYYVSASYHEYSTETKVTVEPDSVSSWGTTVERDSDDDDTRTQEKVGMKVTPMRDIAGLEMRISDYTETEDEEEFILEDLDNNELLTKDISHLEAGDTFSIEYELEERTEYRLVAFAGGGFGDRRWVGYYSEWDEEPYKSMDIDITGGVFEDSYSDDLYFFDEVTAMLTGGEVTISPDEDQTLTAGEELEFTAAAYDQFGNLVTDYQTDFAWQNTDSQGVFYEEDAGEYEVSAAYEDVFSEEITVTVAPGSPFFGSTVERPSDDSSIEATFEVGIEITPRRDLEGLEVRVSDMTMLPSECDWDWRDDGEIRLQDKDGNNLVVWEHPPLESGDTFTITYDLEEDTQYRLVTEGPTSGVEFDRELGRYSWDEEPIESEDIDITDGIYRGWDNRDNLYTFDRVTGIYGARIELSLEEDQTVKAGEELQFSAVVLDELGNVITDTATDFEWENADEEGMFYEETIGNYEVTATYKGFSSPKPATTVTVEPADLDTVTISPEEDQNVTAGEELEFSAEALDEYGNVITDTAMDFEWENADDDGMFYEETSGDYEVTATYDGVTSTETLVTVEPAETEYIEITPEESTLTAGEEVVYNATAYDEYDNEIDDVTDEVNWSIEDGAGGSWDENVYTSENASTWTVTGTYEGVEDEATLTVEPANLDTVVILPEDDQTVTAGEELEFSVEALDEYGNVITDTATDFDWENADEEGIFYEETAGDYEVTATYDDVTSMETLVTVEPAETEYIEITPEESTLTAGEHEAFTATAYDEYDNEIDDVTGEVDWSIEDGAGGSWDQNIYISENAGEWTVKGTYEGVEDESTLIVEPGEVHTVTISPEGDQIVKVGEELLFSAEARDEQGNLLSDNVIDFTWQGATHGVFREDRVGEYEVTATYEGVSSEPTTITVESILEITKPVGGVEELTYEEEFVIEGTTEPNAEVWIDGEEVGVDEEGNFTYETTLVDGQNIFYVEAEDEAGNTASTEVYALYLPDIPELWDEVDSIWAEIDDLQSQIDDQQAEIDDLQEDIDDLQAQIDDLQAEIDDLQAQVDNLEDEHEEAVEDLQAQIDDLETEVEELRDELEQLEEEIEEEDEDEDEIPGFTILLLVPSVILAIAIYHKRLQ